jgi:hypothetical protein
MPEKRGSTQYVGILTREEIIMEFVIATKRLNKIRL